MREITVSKQTNSDDNTQWYQRYAIHKSVMCMQQVSQSRKTTDICPKIIKLIT